MASIVVPKKETQSDVAETNTEELEDSSTNNNDAVSSHLFLRPTHTTETLDKDVVLRRIRHRKRVNSVKSALKGFMGCPVSSKPHQVSVKWVDDAFAAP